MIRSARAQRRLDHASDAVALTFDDGPHPVYTPRVLDELAARRIPATFFVVGRRVREHPQLVQRMLDEGHAVGSHSDTHPEPWTPGLRALTADYRRGRLTLEAVTGAPVELFRPPMGYLDVRGTAAIRLASVRPFLWTIDPRDWEPGVRPAQLLERLGRLAARDVVLFHDAIEGPLAPAALDRSATVEALAAIIDLAVDRGLHFVALR